MVVTVLLLPLILWLIARHMNKDDDNNDGRASAHTRMVLFNDITGSKHKTMKLTATLVFNFLCQGFVKTLYENLLAACHTPSSTAVSVRKARSFFDTLTYSKQLQVSQFGGNNEEKPNQGEI
jgi:hypothetical protein